jgi:hypothetical protein
MKMLGEVEDLSLDYLNRATQAWVELDYNRAEHSTTRQSPVERFIHSAGVLRPSPASDALRDAFSRRVSRTQRRSDGTVTVEGRRFEVPSRFRHLDRLTLRYPRWDLGRVLLVDESTGTVVARLFPLDPTKNASGERAAVEHDAARPAEADGASELRIGELPPLLEKLLEDYEADGLPPGYLPKNQDDDR